MLKQILLVGTGGFIGSVARFFVSKLSNHIHFLSIPIGTLTVNVLGSFMLMQNGQGLSVLIYSALSILLGFTAVYLGYLTSNLL